MNPALVAGVLSGIAGLLVIHHTWIQPIRFILAPGLLIAAGGGLAVGWAYMELLPGHNIPFSGKTSATGKGITILLSIVGVSTVLLVEVHMALSARALRPANCARENVR